MSLKTNDDLTTPYRIEQGPNSEHGRILGRLKAAIVIGFEKRNSPREPIQVKGYHVF